VITYMPL